MSPPQAIEGFIRSKKIEKKIYTKKKLKKVNFIFIKQRNKVKTHDY